LIEVGIGDGEVSILGANIGGGELELARKGLLNGDVVLLNVGVRRF
jgi:hypothetical protein